MTREVRIEEADGESSKITISRLDRASWSELVAKHPPRPNSKDELWNEKTFPQALIAASTGLKPQAARTWWENAPESEANKLYTECLNYSSPGSVAWAVDRMRANSRLMAEVQAAMRAGLSHAEFLTWPDDSQDLAIALALVENDHCPGGCGAKRAEMQNPLAYKVVTSRCVWCQQLAVEKDNIPAEDRGHRHVTLLPSRG